MTNETKQTNNAGEHLARRQRKGPEVLHPSELIDRVHKRVAAPMHTTWERIPSTATPKRTLQDLELADNRTLPEIARIGPQDQVVIWNGPIRGTNVIVTGNGAAERHEIESRLRSDGRIVVGAERNIKVANRGRDRPDIAPGKPDESVDVATRHRDKTRTCHETEIEDGIAIQTIGNRHHIEHGQDTSEGGGVPDEHRFTIEVGRTTTR